MSELLQCDGCGEPFGSTRLVYVNEHHSPVCDDCHSGDVVGVGLMGTYEEEGWCPINHDNERNFGTESGKLRTCPVCGALVA